jgi:hypothetical protein
MAGDDPLPQQSAGNALLPPPIAERSDQQGQEKKEEEKEKEGSKQARNKEAIVIVGINVISCIVGVSKKKKKNVWAAGMTMHAKSNS